MATPNPPQVNKDRLKRKDEALLELLASFHNVFVYIDARREGVTVPKSLRDKYKHKLVLQLGLNLKPTPVRDLVIGKTAWTATLTFDRVPFRVEIPWTAVYLIAAGEGENGYNVSDAKSMPDEFLVEQMQAADMLSKKTPPAKNTPEMTRKTLPPFLRVIEGGKSDTPATPPAGPHKPVS